VEDLYPFDLHRIGHPAGLDRQDHAERPQALTQCANTQVFRLKAEVGFCP
jgi:hypothetical protein